VCAVLEFPVSTYYAVKKREGEPSARAVRDEQLKEQIMRVWENRRKGRRLYGARKVWLQLRREGTGVARCTVERLMGELGIAGVSAQRKKPRTTVPDAGAGRPGDLLERDFTAPAPNRRWVADITYVSTACGFVYTAFVTDLFSARSSAGRSLITCGRAWRWMRWRWRSSPAATASAASLFIIPTGVRKADSTGRRNTSITEVCDGTR
jgi:HTH-like domain